MKESSLKKTLGSPLNTIAISVAGTLMVAMASTDFASADDVKKSAVSDVVVPLRTNIKDLSGNGAGPFQYVDGATDLVNLHNPSLSGPINNYDATACYYEYTSIDGKTPMPKTGGIFAASDYDAQFNPFQQAVRPITQSDLDNIDGAAKGNKVPQGLPHPSFSATGGVRFKDSLPGDVAAYSPSAILDYVIHGLNIQPEPNPKLTIVHGFTHKVDMKTGQGGSMFTVFRPPGFNAYSPTRTYPIVAVGFYDLQEGLRAYGPDIAQLVSVSPSINGQGAIGVLWNGHAGVMSRTVDDASVTEFEYVVKFLENYFKGDSQRIMMFGHSRGGMAPLHLASSLVPHSYSIKYIFAQDVATSLGLTSTLTGPAYVNLVGAASYSVGLANAWKKDFRYPQRENSCGHDASYVGLTGPQAHLKALIGQTDPTYTDANIAPIAPVRINKLVSQGTAVDLQISTNDNVVPTADQFAYLLALRNSHVNFRATINYLTGHFSPQRSKLIGGQAIDQNVLFEDYLFPNFVNVVTNKPITFTSPNGTQAAQSIIARVPVTTCTNWNQANSCVATESALPIKAIWTKDQSPKWPVTLDIPRVYTMDSIAQIVAVGAPGIVMSYTIQEIESDGGQKSGGFTKTYNGTIGPKGNWVQAIDGDLPPGKAYKVTNIKVGSVPGGSPSVVTSIQKTVQYEDGRNIGPNEFRIDALKAPYNFDGGEAGMGAMSWYDPQSINGAINMPSQFGSSSQYPVRTNIMNRQLFFNVTYGGLLNPDQISAAANPVQKKK